MIRITVACAPGPNGRFDMDYYKTWRAALVQNLLDPIGLERFEIDHDAATGAVSGQLVFAPSPSLMADLGAVADDLAADAPNYTDPAATTSFSQIVHRS